jgi:Zn-dependent metalloprotease/PKD repeat protein
MNKFSPLFFLFVCLFGILEAQKPDLKNRKQIKSQVQHTPSFAHQKINGQSKLKSGTPYTKGNNIAFTRPETNPDTLKIVRIIRQTGTLKSASALSTREQGYVFLEKVKSELNITSPKEAFEIKSVNEDELGHRHIRYSQKYKGIKVYNSDIFVHLSNKHEMVQGKFADIRNTINTAPVVNPEQVIETVKKDLETETKIVELTADQKRLLEYYDPKIDTVIFRTLQSFGKFVLAYHVIIRPNYLEEWSYFVDAVNGSILKKLNNTNYDGPFTANAIDLNGIQQAINTYLESGKYYMMDISQTMFSAAKNDGYILTLDAQNSNTSEFKYVQITSANNTWSNKTAVSAHYNAIQAYKYFKNTFNRNSINGTGGSILSFINVAEEDGTSMENAFWNGKMAFYGNGGTAFKPLAGALDVAAHELGHGVIGNSANLEYEGQSGAINEAFADIFGAMAERKNWYIGEDVTKTTYIPTGKLRDMSNPHNGGTSLSSPGWQPMHVSEIYTGTGDNGGVHVNSGIINYAYYLYATAIRKEKAEKVFYRALTTYLGRFSQFLDLRIAIIQSAKDLYGESSNEVTKAKEAFDAVGIYEEEPVQPSQAYPENPGQDYLLVYDTDPLDNNSLYRSTVNASNLLPLTTIAMKGHVSVTDDGSFAYFVTLDDKIKAINLKSTAHEISDISPDAIWDNVAISRDGNRLAAITTDIDTSIYVYDFNLKKWARFYLYNPTTQENLKAGGVLFADAIEFDHTGEYLIFDSFNSYVSTTGDSINYWDIGLMHVWDKKNNKFADGEIVELYGSLPENVSIGNPVFSKNSPYIIAFDFWDAGTDEYAILGLNIETMKLNTIFENTTYGYPTFSKQDNKIAFNAYNTSNEEVIATIGLGANKISPSGTATVLINYAQWPVYYATGTRVLGFAPKANFTATYKSGRAPLTIVFNDLSENDPTSWQWNFPSGNPSTSTLQNPSVTYSSVGTYAVTLSVTNAYGNNAVTKSGYITVSSATGVDNIESKVLIYPNPVNDVLHVETGTTAETLTISIWSLEGKPLKREHATNRIDMTELKSGLYLVKVEGKNVNYQLKVVKE